MGRLRQWDIFYLFKNKGIPISIIKIIDVGVGNNIETQRINRILVVDDEKSILFSIKAILLKEGNKVSTAFSCDEALCLMAKGDFDLILADIVLGGKTGFDLLKESKKQNPNCPVVLITGSPNIVSEAEAFRLGAEDYIPKPLLKDKLLHTVKTRL
jgi:DNA-binding NtrC family response regulator